MTTNELNRFKKIFEKNIHQEWVQRGKLNFWSIKDPFFKTIRHMQAFGGSYLYTYLASFKLEMCCPNSNI